MLNNYLKNLSIIKEIVLYGIIGITCATIDSMLFVALKIIGINIYISNFVSINIGILCSFILNTYFNFKKIDRIKERFCSFFKIGYFGMLLSMIIIYVGNKFNSITDIQVKVFSVIIVAVFQFVLNKIVTYKDKE